MNFLSQLVRLFEINRVLIRHNLDEMIYAIPAFRPLRFIYHLSPWNWGKKDRDPRPIRIRKALEDLGPVFVKFGQILSTRRDMLPDDLANELAKLQDDVPPFSGLEARSIIEKSLNKPITEIFKTFDEIPLASASIAQVHVATLKGGEQDGKEAIVKVVRPGIEHTIRHDIDLMLFIARMVERFSHIGKRLRPIEVVQDYEKVIFDELDLGREAANASQLRRNFIDSPDLYVPDVYWDYCTPEVMVMERIHGIPVGNTQELIDKGINMKVLGERGVEIFFTQVFTHNFFHADMHPGNIFIDENNPNNPKYIAVDFGIMGTLEQQDQRYLAENLHAFFNRDYKRVAEAHIESGWVPAETKASEFEAAIRTVCEPIFQLPIKEISYGKLLLRLFQTAQRFNMEVQPQLVLLQKTLLNIEGMGRELYPDLDLWVTAKPFLQRWMDEQTGLRSLFKGAKTNLPKFIEQLPHMPVMVNEVIRQVHDQQINMQMESRQLEQIRQEIKDANRRSAITLSGSALLITAVLSSTPLLPAVATLSGFTWGIASIGIILMVYGVFKK